MTKTYFFYDLETTGLSARKDRIMQFAGLRTDENFQPLGDPYNLLIELSDDILPSPDALMVTEITPQKTREEGYSEADFAKIFMNEICRPDTIILGFNNVRFDDEFIRALLFRNFYDPYEWAYKDGRSRWDMLDVVRMTRALRPEGINWPTKDGVAVNKLELLTKENGLSHEHAHDALSDVYALLEVTKLIHQKQPQLFNFLEKMRLKSEVQKLVNLDNPQPFVYSSGRYDARFNKTTVVYPVAPAENGNVFVYDLRYDPTSWLNMSSAELEKQIYLPFDQRDENYVKLPIKTLQYNKAPAVAPLGVLSQADGAEKIQINLDEVNKNLSIVRKNQAFIKKVAEILLRKKSFRKSAYSEAKLYDGFIETKDKITSDAVRNYTTDDLKKMQPKFKDSRLQEIYPRYKVRNFPFAATAEEKAAYEDYRINKLKKEVPDFVKALERNSKRKDLTSGQEFVLEELKLWLESITPDVN